MLYETDDASFLQAPEYGCLVMPCADFLRTMQCCAMPRKASGTCIQQAVFKQGHCSDDMRLLLQKNVFHAQSALFSILFARPSSSGPVFPLIHR